jgi:hypothetical protein
MTTCPKCGEEFEPRKMGRPRKYCPLCTPRKPEDVAASNDRHWREEERRRKEHNRRLREQVKRHRATVNANRRRSGFPPL